MNSPFVASRVPRAASIVSCSTTSQETTDAGCKRSAADHQLIVRRRAYNPNNCSTNRRCICRACACACFCRLLHQQWHLNAAAAYILLFCLVTVPQSNPLRTPNRSLAPLTCQHQHTTAHSIAFSVAAAPEPNSSGLAMITNALGAGAAAAPGVVSAAAAAKDGLQQQPVPMPSQARSKVWPWHTRLMLEWCCGIVPGPCSAIHAVWFLQTLHIIKHSKGWRNDAHLINLHNSRCTP
jgi:hypothetical protein